MKTLIIRNNDGSLVRIDRGNTTQKFFEQFINNLRIVGMITGLYSDNKETVLQMYPDTEWNAIETRTLEKD